MAASFRSSGARQNFKNTATAGISAGAIVVLRSGTSGEVGIAIDDIESGGVGAVATAGVFLLPKASGAIALNALVYRNSSGTITATATGNTLAGKLAQEAAASTASTTCLVLVNQRVGTTLD